MKKPVIICVDDEPTILDSLEIELRRDLKDKYLIETAQGGEEALELIEELLSEKYEIALVISDHIMPCIKGDELLKRIHEIIPDSLKIMLTGQADIEAVANAIKYAKLYRYIAKPWQSEDLKLTVKEAVNSYFQEKKLAKQHAELQQMNQTLAKLNSQQADLIDQLKENEDRLRQFLEAMPVGVGVINTEGQPYFINQKAKEIFGVGIVPDITTEQLSEVYQTYKAGTNEKYPVENLPIVRALKGEAITTDDIEVHQNGKVIPVEVAATPIYDSQGNIVYAINTIQEISERRKAESERHHFITEMFELNCNLELALDAESELSQAAQRFVPNQFLSLLGHKSLVDVKLGDQVQQEMSVLFSDIRDFTTLSERMTPQDNFAFINAYLSRMEPAITENNGFIDKYIGDAIMALFSGSADDAVQAGIAMLQTLTEYNKTRARPDRPPISIGIGINTGSLMLGTVGGKNRMDSTVISDAVNLASRVETLTKYYGVSMLITHETFLQLNEPIYAIRPLDRAMVKGKSEWVMLYEVFDADPPQIKDAKLATYPRFLEALYNYRIEKFRESEKLFADCLRQNPQDKVAQNYIQRCQDHNGNKPKGGFSDTQLGNPVANIT